MLSFRAIFRQKIGRWQAIAGLGFHVLDPLLFPRSAIAAGRTTVFLLPLWLSPTEQSYYLTFAGVLALQAFLSRGSTKSSCNLSAMKKVAHLTETADGRLRGKDSPLDRLSSLARLFRSWFGVAAMLFAPTGGIAGAAFFSQKEAWLKVISGYRQQYPTRLNTDESYSIGPNMFMGVPSAVSTEGDVITLDVGQN